MPESGYFGEFGNDDTSRPVVSLSNRTRTLRSTAAMPPLHLCFDRLPRPIRGPGVPLRLEVSGHILYAGM